MFIIKAFRTVNGREVFAPTWGLALQRRGDHVLQGIWLRMDSTPMLAPWHAPLTWGELRRAGIGQGIDVD